MLRTRENGIVIEGLRSRVFGGFCITHDDCLWNVKKATGTELVTKTNNACKNCMTLHVCFCTGKYVCTKHTRKHDRVEDIFARPYAVRPRKRFSSTEFFPFLSGSSPFEKRRPSQFAHNFLLSQFLSSKQNHYQHRYQHHAILYSTPSKPSSLHACLPSLPSIWNSGCNLV